MSPYQTGTLCMVSRASLPFLPGRGAGAAGVRRVSKASSKETTRNHRGGPEQNTQEAPGRCGSLAMAAPDAHRDKRAKAGPVLYPMDEPLLRKCDALMKNLAKKSQARKTLRTHRDIPCSPRHSTHRRRQEPPVSS